jgi:hypothetical protein
MFPVLVHLMELIAFAIKKTLLMISSHRKSGSPGKKKETKNIPVVNRIRCVLIEILFILFVGRQLGKSRLAAGFHHSLVAFELNLSQKIGFSRGFL